MPNPVVHWEIASDKPAELNAFYRDLFGWKVDADNQYDYGMVDTQTEQGINGGIGGTMGGPRRVTVYAEVDDLQTYLDKAVSLGGKIMMEPTEIPGTVTMAMFADPDGNAFGLIKRGS